MNGTAARFLRLGVSLTGLVTLGWVLTGQAARPHRGTPVPTDWSHRHLIFSHPATSEQAARVSEDPRYGQQLQRLNHRLAIPAQSETAVSELQMEPVFRASKRKPLFSRNFRRDWSEDLGTGAGAGAGNYPAKFVFESNVANCGNATTPDYVVYSTGLAGSGTQADIVAYDNLYTGCTGTVPTAYWAYNTGGQILTSPVLSRDGTQVAFVQTNVVNLGTLVLLRWKALDGTIGLPDTLTPVSNAAYPTCTAPCMTTIGLVDNTSHPVDDRTSSVFYDYLNDVAWVGGANGWIHKITGMFKGTPAEVTTGGFPARVGLVFYTSSPVYDHVSNSVFVTDQAGSLDRVDPTTGAVTVSVQVDFSGQPTTISGPVVDSSNGLVYVFASEDNSLACSLATLDCTAVFVFPTSFTNLTVPGKAVVGSSSAGGVPTPSPFFIGGFDHNYFSSANGTGNLYVCGNTGLNPILYQIPITAGVMGTPVVVSTLTPAAQHPACSPVTNVSTPPTTAGNATTDRLFVSVQNNSNACAGGGCIQNLISTPWQASTTFSTGQELLVESLLSPGVRFIMAATTTAATGATEPGWPNSPGATKSDGSQTWINQGNPDNVPLPWAANTLYALGNRVIDTVGQVEIVTTAGNSGAGAPAWATTPNTPTPDGIGTLVWNNLGAYPIAALVATGGTSGIIIDNTVTTGTPTGTSQVYFTTLGNQACGTSGTGGCAVQASQSGLQ